MSCERIGFNSTVRPILTLNNPRLPSPSRRILLVGLGSALTMPAAQVLQGRINRVIRDQGKHMGASPPTMMLISTGCCLNRPHLPNPHPLIGHQVIGIPGLHIERLVPAVIVARRADDAGLRGRVGVGFGLLDNRLSSLLPPPELRPGEEHPL